MLASPRAVLFDLDDTLLDRAPTFERYFVRFAERYAEMLGPCDAKFLRETILDADGVGYRTRDEMARMLLDKLPWRSPPAIQTLVDNYRADFLACACPSDGIDDLLSRLKSRHIKSGVITNGISEVQRRKIERLGLIDHMDVILVSEEVGVKKPDPLIFQRAAEQLGVAANETWFIGDHPEFDVAGAEAVGMTGFWLARMTPWPATLPPPARRIESLRDIIKLIEHHRA